MKQIELREGARRQHRAIALYALIQCWQKGYDGVAFERKQLERLLGLDRFKGKRIEWLQEDLREYFQYQKVYWLTGKKKSIGSLFVARKPFDKSLPAGSMTTEERLRRTDPAGPSLNIFRMWPELDDVDIGEQSEATIPFFENRVNGDERVLSTYLALLVQGQLSPREIF